MALLSLQDLCRELAVPPELVEDLIQREVITPFGGRARLGEPKFSATSVPGIRQTLISCDADCSGGDKERQVDTIPATITPRAH